MQRLSNRRPGGGRTSRNNRLRFARCTGERAEDPSELADAIRRGLENVPAVIGAVTSRDISSDATKGLSVVPDYPPLSAWDDAERRRRGEA